MLEDRKNEGDCEDIQESIPAPSDSCQPGPVLESSQEVESPCFISSAGTEEGPSEEHPSCSIQDSLPDTIELNVIPLSALEQGWNALIGEFDLYPKIPFVLGDDSFCLQKTGDNLSLSLDSHELEVETGRSGPLCPVPIECSFGGKLLEDLDWLQKRKVIKLCHASGDESVKVCTSKSSGLSGFVTVDSMLPSLKRNINESLCFLSICFFEQLKIFLLESGLGRPEFLSEGNGRIKKANQLLQKLMEFFYDFIIPGNLQYNFNMPPFRFPAKSEGITSKLHYLLFCQSKQET